MDSEEKKKSDRVLDFIASCLEGHSAAFAFSVLLSLLSDVIAKCGEDERERMLRVVFRKLPSTVEKIRAAIRAAEKGDANK